MPRLFLTFFLLMIFSGLSLCLESSIVPLIEQDCSIQSDELLVKHNGYAGNIHNRSTDFILVTMPKTGTHLMKPLLQKLTARAAVWTTAAFPYIHDVLDINKRDKAFKSINIPIHWFQSPISPFQFISKLQELKKNGQFLYAHAPYSPQLENVLLVNKAIAFFVIRDPRDYVVSLLQHVIKYKNNFVREDWFYSLSTDEQIYYLITGTDWYNSTTTVLNEFIKWKDSSVCCALRFEELLGSNGGSYTEKEQMKELRKIANSLNLRISDEELLNCFKESFGKGFTFNKAKVGRWKSFFNESNKALFKQLLGKELIELGYEKDYNW